MNDRVMNFGVPAVVACAMFSAILTGCDWSGGAGASNSNSRYNFVNFSGDYRGVNGGLLVTDYTQSAGTSVGNTSATNGASSVTNSISGAQVATGNGIDTAFAGTLGKTPVVPGTATFSAPPSYAFSDPTGSGTLTATSPTGTGASGTINYNTGAWSLDFAGAALDMGAAVRATYQYVSTVAGTAGSGGSGSGSGGSSASGASGAEIHSFVIEQYGNGVTITDNNGATYKGTLGDIRGTGGVSQDTQKPTPTTTTSAANGSSTATAASTPVVYVIVGDQFTANFTAKGTSAANMKVNMTGVFQATITSALQSNFTLGNRTMTGTWIESGGRTGDINGSTTPINTTSTTAVAAGG